MWPLPVGFPVCAHESVAGLSCFLSTCVTVWVGWVGWVGGEMEEQSEEGGRERLWYCLCVQERGGLCKRV